jgi:hypothetical protein
MTEQKEARCGGSSYLGVGRLRQEAVEFEAGLGYIGRPHSKKQSQKTEKGK